MHRTIRRLTTAAATAAGLALIPLTLASSASAATTSVLSSNQQNWAGYVDTASGSNIMESVSVSFTVPQINCSKSVIGPREMPASYRKTHGNDWSAVGFWVGLDGKEAPAGKPANTAIEQAGITGICHSQYGTAVYVPFYQIDTYQVVNPALSMGRPVKAGDHIQLYVGDSLPEYYGHTYQMKITDLTQYGETWSGNERTPAQAPDVQAEIITEAVTGGPYASKANAPHGTVGLAAFSPVTYTHGRVTSGNSSGGWPMTAHAPYWTLTRDFVGTGPAPFELIATGKLGRDASGYSTFTNYFTG